MVNKSFKAREAQPSEKALIIDLIHSNLLVILAYFLFKVNPVATSALQFQKTRVELPVPYEISSIVDILNYVSELEEIHGVEPGSVVLLGKFGVSDLHDRTVLLNRSRPEMLAEAFDYSIKEEDSLFELIERCEPSVIETRIHAYLSSFYSVSVNAKMTNPWPVKNNFFMPYYEIQLPVQNQALSLKEIENRVHQNFHVLSFEVVEGKMRFFCEADEGQYVNTIHDVVRIIEKENGPDIRTQFANQGLVGASICFHIDVLYC